MTTLGDVEEIANGLYNRLKASSKGKQVNNVKNHFAALVQSHGYSDMNQSALPFWDALLKDDFFEEAQMPKSWKSKSSYGQVLTSLTNIMKEPVVKDILVNTWTPEGYVKALNTCEERRKSFVRNYKKIRRTLEIPNDVYEEDVCSDSDIMTDDVVSDIQLEKTESNVDVEESNVDVEESNVDLEESNVELVRLREGISFARKYLDGCMKIYKSDETLHALQSIKLALDRI
jgi:hypothetical protein